MHSHSASAAQSNIQIMAGLCRLLRNTQAVCKHMQQTPTGWLWMRVSGEAGTAECKGAMQHCREMVSIHA